MRKKMCTLFAILTLTLASSITAFAAPEIMPDGDVFDAEYYAQNNLDVVAVLGTDRDALYSHYVNNGKAEGRLRTAPVELTKARLVISTAKRKQLAQERYMQDYGCFMIKQDIGLAHMELQYIEHRKQKTSILMIGRLKCISNSNKQ